jgi:hypothetical protein
MMPIYLHSGMQGAPKIQNTEGGAIAVYDAALVTGFNTQTVSSATASGGVVTFNFASAPGFEALHRITVAGATPAGVNGDWTVQSAASNQVLVAIPGVADGAVTGTVTMKFTPLGWEKPYSAAGLAVYRPVSTLSTRPYLRVYDPVGTNFYTRGYSAMTGVSSGTNPFPTVAQVAGNGHSHLKNYYNFSAGANWFLIGDEQGFVLVYDGYGSASFDTGYTVTFGDLVSFKPSDSGRAYLGGGAGSLLGYSAGVSRHMATDWTGTIASETARALLVSNSPYARSRGGPDPTTGHLVMTRPVLSVSTTGIIRGIFPGQVDLLCSTGGYSQGVTILSNIPGISGRIAVLLCGGEITGFVIDEAWR